ncbi:hypothetical protein CF319_g4570 [Tilletia indica]|nr:hypothetical protein CF319_g4570 [Tilletia indica]
MNQPNQQPSTPTQRGEHRRNAQSSAGDQSGSQAHPAPGNQSAAQGHPAPVVDMAADGENTPSNIAPEWDPMDWQAVFSLTREMFYHVAPCAERWTDAQRNKVSEMLYTLAYVVMPKT